MCRGFDFQNLTLGKKVLQTRHDKKLNQAVTVEIAGRGGGGGGGSRKQHVTDKLCRQRNSEFFKIKNYLQNK